MKKLEIKKKRIRAYMRDENKESLIIQGFTTGRYTYRVGGDRNFTPGTVIKKNG